MFIGRVTNWTSVVGTAIPFATVINSNNKISNNNGVISLKRPALWDIDGTITLTGVTGEIIVSVWADGVETGAFAETELTTDVAIQTVPIKDVVRTVIDQYPNVANIELRVDTAGVTTSGTLTVSYID